MDRTGPRLPAVEEAADTLLADLQTAQKGSLFQVLGAPTAGKSAVLRSLEERMQDSRVPILVAPPTGALDAGALALMQIGVGLKQHGFINGQFDALADPERRWSSKLDLVQTWLRDAADGIALLCDEPDTWAPADHPSVAHFAEHADEVKYLILLRVDAPRVITGSIPGLARPDKTLEVEKQSDPSSFLSDSRRWGALTDSAEALRDSGFQLSSFSNLELRLLVAHVALGSIDEVLSWLPGVRRRGEISRRLAIRLAHSDPHGRLWRIWQNLAYVRRPVDEDLLAQLGASELDERGRSVLRECLLYPLADGKYVLHNTLQADALSVDATREVAVAAHRTLATFFKQRFEAASDGDGRAPAFLLDEMESFHHATESGDLQTYDELRVFFVDQLDALGQHLSHRQRKYAAAARVFERATQWDDSDDYAHHYLAFNLDVEGRDPEVVEREYRKALDIEPRNSLWWARFVSFLVIRGRVTDAREAWEDATDELLSPHEVADEFLYDHLHAWVARALLHRGHLDFARSLLGTIPSFVRSERIDALQRRLTALEEAQKRGAYAPAAYLDNDEWWRKGPFLLEHRDPRTEERLVRWIAGRVEAVHDAEVLIRGIHVTVSDTGEPEVVTTQIPFEQFNRLVADDVPAREIEAGTFVEIGLYAGAGRKAAKTSSKIRVHSQSQWRDDALPRLFPDPQRYLDRSTPG
jgi:tetratricopeptide (TPR) repeat protein